MNVPSVKIARINWKYLIDNALNKELWGKRYTLFDYDGMDIVLYLDSISAKNQSLSFVVVVKVFRNDEEYLDYNYLTVPLGQYNEEAFSNKLHGTIKRTMEELERTMIRDTPYYKMAESTIEEKKEIAEDMANELLDSLNIENYGIRSSYVSDQRSKVSSSELSEVVRQMQYSILTPHFITYGLMTEQDVSKFGNPQTLSNIEEYIKSIVYEDIELDEI